MPREIALAVALVDFAQPLDAQDIHARVPFSFPAALAAAPAIVGRPCGRYWKNREHREPRPDGP
jgi:hypothetical protein